MSGEGDATSLEQTPTWAVALVCTVFVVASLVVERFLEFLGKYLKRMKQKELVHTLNQIKDELMLLGFISLFLTVFQPKVASLCMPERLKKFMLPCKYEPPAVAPSPAARRRRLFEAAATTSGTTCPPGKVQVISVEGLHQLHLFIFVMAVVHVLYSCLTVLAGLWQVHSWKKWEVETWNDDYNPVQEAMRCGKVTDESGATSLSGRTRYKFLHTSRTGLFLTNYVYSFFRQFGRPVYRGDYLCLRLGFLTNHQLDKKYDFHSYIRRTMEDDFRHVVGISAYLWAFVCIFLLVDIYGWYTYFWLAFVPTFLALMVGMKLQQIITSLAVEVRGGCKKIDREKDGRHPGKYGEEYICKGVRPRDELFWFCRPQLMLYLVHFILFQNAFELAFFFWTTFTYGYHSCLVGKTWMVAVRLSVGVGVQILCSACTLPLYALVTQLGSKIKFSVFKSEATRSALKVWTKKAKKKHNEKGHVHIPLGIIGLNKELDENGHPVNLVHPHTNGMKQHNDHEDGQHPLSPPQSYLADDSHTVEIL